MTLLFLPVAGRKTGLQFVWLLYCIRFPFLACLEHQHLKITKWKKNPWKINHTSSKQHKNTFLSDRQYIQKFVYLCGQKLLTWFAFRKPESKSMLRVWLDFLVGVISLGAKCGAGLTRPLEGSIFKGHSALVTRNLKSEKKNISATLVQS